MNNANAKRKVLITGVTGFIGANLMRRLVSLGHDVHVLVRKNANRDLATSWPASVTVHEHDGTTEGMTTLVANAAPQVVYHLASLFLAQHRPQDIEALVKSNLLFGAQIAEAMVANGVHALVNTGTSWQSYEGTQGNPVNLYAATKQAFENLLEYYVQAHGLKVTTLVLSDTYGPGDPRAKLVALLWKTALAQTTLSMSPGDQLIDLVHVDDVVDAFLWAGEAVLTQETGHERYSVTSGNPVKLRDIAAAFESATDLKLQIEWGGRPYRTREVMVPHTGYRRIPGFSPKVPFMVGILQTRPAA